MNDAELSDIVIKLKSLGLHPNGYAYLSIDHDGHGMDCGGCMGCTILPRDIQLDHLDRAMYLEICIIMGEHPYLKEHNY